MNDKLIQAFIKPVEHILSQRISIPDYQRPYRWEEQNVRLLLQDIYESWKSGKTSYRIGNIILYTRDHQDYDIVDGQQRVTTLLLIFKILDDSTGKNLCDSLAYNQLESQNRILTNYGYIENWLTENVGNGRDLFAKYISHNCEFVKIIVKNLSEAFQMFDAQNGRGKELETYNLLKAFHIRAMEGDSAVIKISCDQKWENATRYQSDKKSENESVDLLKQVFDEQLYRTRLWSRKKDAYNFTKKNISEFKGYTISQSSALEFPFQNTTFLLHKAKKYFSSIGVEVKGILSRSPGKESVAFNPFVLINQPFINGNDFFEYIDNYVQIYKYLFLNNDLENGLAEFREFYRYYCESYKGSARDGDRYLKELYKSLLFLIYDKYGEEGINRYHKLLFALVYRLRLEKLQIKYAAIAQYPTAEELFSIIEESRSYIDLQPLEKKAKSIVVCNKEVERIIEFFVRHEYTFDKEKSGVDVTPYQKIK